MGRVSNLPLVLSLVTLALGFVLYLGHQKLRRALIWLEERGPNLDAGWDTLLDRFVSFTKAQTAVIQTGVLRQYMFATFAVLAATVLVTLALRGAGGIELQLTNLSFMEWGVALLIVAGTVVTALTSSRIVALVALGVVGSGVALIFHQLFSGTGCGAITQLLGGIAGGAFDGPPPLPENAQKSWTRTGHQKHSFGECCRPRQLAPASAIGNNADLAVRSSDQTLATHRRLTEFSKSGQLTFKAFGRQHVNVILEISGNRHIWRNR